MEKTILERFCTRNPTLFRGGMMSLLMLLTIILNGCNQIYSVSYTKSYTQSEIDEFAKNCTDCFVLTSESGCYDIRNSNWYDEVAFITEDNEEITYEQFCNEDGVKCEFKKNRCNVIH